MTRVMCRKCLLADMDMGDIERSILQYIKELPEDKKADDETYRARLVQCRSCECLINGMCAECGCYVELRAAKKNMYCAGKTKKW